MMHLLIVDDHMNRFDAGTDYLYCKHAYLMWRQEEQRLPSGHLCAIVQGTIGNWQITPFANKRFIKTINELPGIDKWLDGQAGTRYRPSGLHVHHRSDFHSILASPSLIDELARMIEQMNDFMRKRFKIEVWRGDTELPETRLGVKSRGRRLRSDFVDDLLKLQAA